MLKGELRVELDQRELAVRTADNVRLPPPTTETDCGGYGVRARGRVRHAPVASGGMKPVAA